MHTNKDIDKNSLKFLRIGETIFFLKYVIFSLTLEYAWNFSMLKN